MVTAREILSNNEQECPVYTTRPRKSVSGALVQDGRSQGGVGSEVAFWARSRGRHGRWHELSWPTPEKDYVGFPPHPINQNPCHTGHVPGLRPPPGSSKEACGPELCPPTAPTVPAWAAFTAAQLETEGDTHQHPSTWNSARTPGGGHGHGPQP